MINVIDEDGTILQFSIQIKGINLKLWTKLPNFSNNNGPKCNLFGYTPQSQNWSIFINDITHQFLRKEQTIKCASLRLEHNAESKNVAEFPQTKSDPKINQ